MIKVGIIGASGYTGLEIIRILAQHPDVELTILTSEQFEGKAVSSVFPSLDNIISNSFTKLNAKTIIASCDFVFIALPHMLSMKIVPSLLEAGLRVVDLSADFRIKEVITYEKWYCCTHTTPHLLKNAIYGLPELYRKEIISAKLVANPGCFPTSILLALAPIIDHAHLDPASVIIDAKSGVSGAGRTLAPPYLYTECNEKVKAYSITTHRHTPEIEQELSRLAAKPITVTFTPHLVPISRGILSTVYCTFTETIELKELETYYKNFYSGEPFIRITKEDMPTNTGWVSGSNYCNISIHHDKRTNRIIVVSAIDNLLKGASGQAVQNMNIMCGFAEDTALKFTSTLP